MHEKLTKTDDPIKKSIQVNEIWKVERKRFQNCFRIDCLILTLSTVVCLLLIGCISNFQVNQTILGIILETWRWRLVRLLQLLETRECCRAGFLIEASCCGSERGKCLESPPWRTPPCGPSCSRAAPSRSGRAASRSRRSASPLACGPSPSRAPPAASCHGASSSKPCTAPPSGWPRRCSTVACGRSVQPRLGFHPTLHRSGRRGESPGRRTPGHECNEPQGEEHSLAPSPLRWWRRWCRFRSVGTRRSLLGRYWDISGLWFDTDPTNRQGAATAWIQIFAFAWSATRHCSTATRQ